MFILKGVEQCQRLILQGRSDRFFYILPASSLVREAKLAILEHPDIMGFPYVNLSTLKQLVNYLLQLEDQDWGFLDELSRRMLLGELLRNLAQEHKLDYFQSVADYPGYAQVFSRIISELKQASARPGDLFRLWEGRQQLENPGLVSRIKDICTVYQAYQDALESRQVLDEEDRYLKACEILQRDRKISWLEPIDILIVEEFFDLTRIQADLIKALARRVKHCQVYLGYQDERKEIHAVVDRAVKLLEPLAVEVYSSGDAVSSPGDAVLSPGDTARQGSVFKNPSRFHDFLEETALSSQQKPSGDTKKEKRLCLKQLSENLFRGAAERSTEMIEPGDMVQVWAAAGEEREVLEIGREIKRLVKSGMYVLQDICLVIRDTATYTPVLRRVFTELGISLELAAVEPLAQNPLIKSCLLLIDAVANEERFELGRILNNQYLCTEPEALLLRQLWNRENDKASRKEWLNRLEHQLKRIHWRLENVADDADSEEVTALSRKELEQELERLTRAQEFLARFLDCWDLVPSRGSMCSIIRGVKALLAALRVEENLYVILNNGNPADLELIARDRAAWQAFYRILDQLEIMATWSKSERMLDRSTFLRQLQKTVQAASYSPVNPQSGGVMVCSPHELRGRYFPVVFVLGLVEGSFPRNIQEDWVFPDEVRKSLSWEGNPSGGLDSDLSLADTIHTTDRARVSLSTCGNLLLCSNDLILQEKFLFYLAVRAATGRLYLTYPFSTVGGKRTLVSSLVEEVQALYPGLKTKYFIDELMGSIQEAASIQEALVGLTREIANSEQWERREELVESLFLTDFCPWKKVFYQVQVEKTRRQKYSSWDGLLQAPDIISRLSKQYARQIFSAGALGTFGKCPMAYFFERVLKLIPVERVEEELTPLERGQIYHEVLRRFFLPYRGSCLKRAELDNYRKQLEEQADQVFAELNPAVYYPHVYIWELERRVILDRLWAIVKREVEQAEKTNGWLKPAYLEWGFGMKPEGGMDESSWSRPVEVKLPVGQAESIAAGLACIGLETISETSFKVGRRTSAEVTTFEQISKTTSKIILDRVSETEQTIPENKSEIGVRSIKTPPITPCAKTSADDSKVLRIRGRIDRIDVTADKGFVVYDYKSGKGPDLQSVYEGRDFQLPLYLLAAQALLGREAYPVGAAFYSINQAAPAHGFWDEEFRERLGFSKSRRKGIFNKSEWQEFMGQVVAFLVEYRDALQKGCFILDPKECPAYCNFRFICRYDRLRIQKIKDES